MAEALDNEEIERFRWWITAQQDPNKFIWSSPDKAGTEPVAEIYQTIADFSQHFTIGDWELKYERAKDLSQSVGRPLIYMTPDRKYFDEKGNPVILFDDYGEPTTLGNRAVVIPMRPDGEELRTLPN